ncbi:MAG: hypothetical protein M1486_04720, partial [Gammaproteobacteria bacterium]|nr:hypothetical protein [Gammaproteobacteria bacterium]
MDVKNYDELLNCIQCAVKDEIDYRKCYSREKKSKGILLTGGKRLEDVSEYFLYMFLLKDKLDISLDFSYLLVIGNNYYEGSISLLTDEKLVWASGIDLGERENRLS